MAETIKISIPQEVLTIEVNDAGDTIVLPVSDERFSKRLLDFTEALSKESEKINSIDQQDTACMINADIEFHERLHEEFNKLFGEKAYEKVYGENIVVGAEYVIEFIDKCLPYIQKYTAKRAEKFNKYSANRVGSSL